MGDRYRKPSSGSLFSLSTIFRGSVILSSGGEYRVNTVLGFDVNNKVLDRLRIIELSLGFEKDLILDSSRGAVGGCTFIISVCLGSRCSINVLCFSKRFPGSSGRGEVGLICIGSTEPLFCLLARGSGRGSLGPWIS